MSVGLSVEIVQRGESNLFKSSAALRIHSNGMCIDTSRIYYALSHSRKNSLDLGLQ
jgi:hypothetical protein